MFAASAACLLLVLTATANEAAPPSRPNIVIVLVDDMGFSDVGCYGGEIDTPNIDRLATGGLRFTQFYNAGRCCPTRASLMTGRHPHQVGIGHMTAPPKSPLGFEGPYQGYLNDNCVTIAQVLKSAGYHTLMTGKWHLGADRKECWPLQRGFDRYYGGLSGAFNYFKPGGDRGITRGNDPVGTDAAFYATDTFTDVACEYISDVSKKDDQPFFLYLAYNAPHWPLNSKWDEFQKYKGKYMEGWEALMIQRLAKQKKIGLVSEDIQPAPHVGPKWDSLNEKQRENLDSIMAAYAGCIDSIDQNIGKLTRHLDQLGELDNTVIFFLSDNGACQEGGRLGQGNAATVKDPPLETTAGVRLGLAWANACNTPFRLYKHFVHEGGACTPMIASWPAGIRQDRRGSFVRDFAYLPDFMATCAELAGADYPQNVPPCEGVSVVPLLKGSNTSVHKTPIYWEHEGNAAVRWGDWKLVREYQKPWELYDLDSDRAEMNNLAETQQGKRDEMVALWETWAKKNEVAFPKRFNMYEFLRNKRQKKPVTKRPKTAAKSSNLPNIIFMMADDMGLGDTSSYQDVTDNSDAEQVKTPAMERLAKMGIRFTDAHSPSSRCTATRQALLTGRYTWRTRLKYSVLWGPQGDPLIEPNRPTLATLLRDSGYRTGMSGKWHVGLTYRRVDGRPATSYDEVDLRHGIADGPLNHGFDFFHGTSRSHPTSRLQGWLFGKRVLAAIGPRQVNKSQYVLNETGPKNYEMAKRFLDEHFANEEHRIKPFFLYYACHSNHLSHDPCDQLGERKVKGQSHPGGKRSDFIYENDVALDLLLEFLQETDDPRRPGAKLLDNTLVIFTSDNGSESKSKTATGPLRSFKGSVYEGGHRVPFIAAWKQGRIGDGDAGTAGQTSAVPICHVDIFATLAEILGKPLPSDAAEDSVSVLGPLCGNLPASRPPLIHHDHKEGAPPRKAATSAAAWLAIRVDDPVVAGKPQQGQWKLLVDEGLLIKGKANPRELYELASDLAETTNRVNEPALQPLVLQLTARLQDIHDRGGIRRQSKRTNRLGNQP